VAVPNAPSFTTNNVRSLDELHGWLAGGREEILEPALPIVDPHHHLRETAHGRYLLPELSDDLASGHNIRATVFVDSQSMHRADGPVVLRPVGETDFVLDSLAAASASRVASWNPCAGIVGNLDLTFGAAVREALQAHIAAGQGRFRGIRDPLMWDGSDINYGVRRPPPDRMTDPRFRAGFAELAPLGMTFDAWLFQPQLPLLIDLARSFPDTTIVLNHVGAPLGIGPYAGQRAEIFESWRSSLIELARCPNVVVKVGGLGMLFFGFGFERRDVPASSAELATAWRPYVETCIDAFAPARCMFESNFPVDKQSCSYATLWNAYKRIAAGYSAEEKSAMFFGTANRIYRLGLE
jgi:predicted TIM-barrel fold metal-dependent hydrolase